jgi:phosphate acetyltransferase
MALGLVQALRRDHVSVGFVKPIRQPGEEHAADLSTYFARTLLKLDSPEPLAFETAEARVRSGGLDALLEDLVGVVETAGKGCDAVVVEGLIPSTETQIAARLNAAMARAFAASLVPVLASGGRTPQALSDMVALTLAQFAESEEPPPLAGVLINHLTPDTAAAPAGTLPSGSGTLPVLAEVPFEAKLQALRLADVAEALKLRVDRAGNMASARVEHVVIAGRGVEGLIDRLEPGALVVAAGERSDIALACALACTQGLPLSGLLLTCGTALAPQVLNLLKGPGLADLPILSTDDDTFATGASLAALSHHVRGDDSVRMGEALTHAATHIDTTMLRERIGSPGPVRMPPPAFRYQLIQAARAAGKRIVLPEGDEPRTIQAAAICQTKGIATCVLLGDEARIRAVATEQGVELPTGLEILDPAAVRAKYVPPMVELRKSKGLTPEDALKQLEDTVVLGTMMLAQNDVDGLVSGAVHTTANTIRPALQLIRTAPGASIVSSVFFMLMPNQVFVYGDCAVNPDPTAEELADIAIQSATSAKAFGIDPRVAMISYSTGTSGKGADVDKVRQALEIAHTRAPDLLIDGPLQYDAASVESVGRQKAPGSKVAGQANVFIFPDLNTGNTTYKAVQRSAHLISIGPMLQGLRKPVNDLSRGALVDDIVFTIALTAIQAANNKK